jgi:hypothetical protein
MSEAVDFGGHSEAKPKNPLTALRTSLDPSPEAQDDILRRQNVNDYEINDRRNCLPPLTGEGWIGVNKTPSFFLPR